MPLTDMLLRNRKSESQPFKLADGGGLYLLVKPNGTRSWRMDYRFAGKRKTLSIGLYPTVGLSDARQKREEAKKLISAGQDPSIKKRLDRIHLVNVHANTFKLVAEEYLDKMGRDGKANATIDKNRWMMIDLAAPLARRPISEISAAEVLETLRSIERSGRIESAVATRAAIGRVFRYAIATARAENDPSYALRGALQRPQVVSHPALVKPKAVGGLMRAVFEYEGWPTLIGALKVQALCFTRPGETRHMEWDDLELEQSLWTIPAKKTKMRRSHDVPLSRQAVEVIRGMRPFSGNNRYVFTSMMSGKSVLSENSMNSALRRMGFSSAEHTAHGFRSTASTLLNESKLFDADVIDAQMAHQDPRKVRRIYNRAEYWDDRVRMMQWWSDEIDRLRALRDSLVR
jgi:integrase